MWHVANKNSKQNRWTRKVTGRYLQLYLQKCFRHFTCNSPRANMLAVLNHLTLIATFTVLQSFPPKHNVVWRHLTSCAYCVKVLWLLTLPNFRDESHELASYLFPSLCHPQSDCLAERQVYCTHRAIFAQSKRSWNSPEEIKSHVISFQLLPLDNISILNAELCAVVVDLKLFSIFLSASTFYCGDIFLLSFAFKISFGCCWQLSISLAMLGFDFQQQCFTWTELGFLAESRLFIR